VSAAFHSSFLTGMKEQFRETLRQLNIYAPQKKVIRNYDANIYQNKDDIIEGLVEQIDHTVLFQKTVEYCFSKHINKFIDVNISLYVFLLILRLAKKEWLLQC